MRSTFGQIAVLTVKVLKILTWASYSLQNRKTVRFQWKLRKTLFLGHAQPFWPNRSFDRQSSQNRHTGLNFSSKKENTALLKKIVQNALFRSSAARFGQIAFFTVKVLKIVKLAWNSRQHGKTVRFPWKLRKTLFLGHAQHVFAKSRFWPSKFSKSWNWPQILFKTEQQCAFHENCTKRFFQLMRSTFWLNHIFERASSQNPHTGLKFSPNGKTVRFPLKLC